MTISSEKLKKLILSVATEKYGKGTFSRRPLMVAVERKARELGYWEANDDVLSGSRGTKSKGLAQIDYRISDLKRECALLNTGRDAWKLP